MKDLTRKLPVEIWQQILVHCSYNLGPFIDACPRLRHVAEAARYFEVCVYTHTIPKDLVQDPRLCSTVQYLDLNYASYQHAPTTSENLEQLGKLLVHMSGLRCLELLFFKSIDFVLWQELSNLTKLESVTVMSRYQAVDLSPFINGYFPSLRRLDLERVEVPLKCWSQIVEKYSKQLKVLRLLNCSDRSRRIEPFLKGIKSFTALRELKIDNHSWEESYSDPLVMIDGFKAVFDSLLHLKVLVIDCPTHLMPDFWKSLQNLDLKFISIHCQSFDHCASLEFLQTQRNVEWFHINPSIKFKSLDYVFEMLQVLPEIQISLKVEAHENFEGSIDFRVPIYEKILNKFKYTTVKKARVIIAESWHWMHWHVIGTKDYS